MSDQEILTKAVEKAIAGGWKPFQNDETITLKNYEYELYIYNHDFAKALWGEDWIGYGLQNKPYSIGRNYHTNLSPWQYHLQQMVIAENPIQYLKENI